MNKKIRKIVLAALALTIALAFISCSRSILTNNNEEQATWERFKKDIYPKLVTDDEKQTLSFENVDVSSFPKTPVYAKMNLVQLAVFKSEALEFIKGKALLQVPSGTTQDFFNAWWNTSTTSPRQTYEEGIQIDHNVFIFPVIKIIIEETSGEPTNFGLRYTLYQDENGEWSKVEAPVV